MDRTFSGSASLSVKSSSVVFGDLAVPLPRAVVFTSMLQNMKMDTFYYVELTSINVGGSWVAEVLVVDLQLGPETGRGEVIMDSGMSVMWLMRLAYATLRDAFKAGVAELREASGRFALFET